MTGSGERLKTLVAHDSGRFDPYMPEPQFPTPSMSSASMAWHDAALEESQRLLECARDCQDDNENMSSERCETLFKYARELQELSTVLKVCPGIENEVAAEIRRICINRIIRINELSKDQCK